MNALAVEPFVRRIVADSLGVDVEQLAPEVSLIDDLAADSLDLLEVALALEGELGITVPERVLSGVRTYGELVEATIALADAHQAAAIGRAGVAPFVRMRTTPADGRSHRRLERTGWLTPYVAQEVAEDALRLGRGARLEVAVGAETDDAGLAHVRALFGRLGDRGVRVKVIRDERAQRKPSRERAA